MKKFLVVCIAALLVMLLAVSVGLAEGFEPTEPKESVPAPNTDKFENAGKIEIGVFYSFEPYNRVEWVFYPKETGNYTFYCRCVDGGVSYEYKITDKFGNMIESLKIKDQDYNPTIKSVELTAGKEYHISRSGWGVAKGGATVFAICAPSQHVGPLTAYQVVEEPTCTEPGAKAQCCALCGGEVGCTVIPPAGHTPGKDQVYEEATCLATGLRGVKCTVCGEYISKSVIPMAAHQPDVWMDQRAATCTGDGVRVQRCKVCGETLKTETVPAFGHSFSEWMTYSDTQQSRYCAYCGYTEYRNNP